MWKDLLLPQCRLHRAGHFKKQLSCKPRLATKESALVIFILEFIQTWHGGTHNPSTGETEAQGFQVWDQLGRCSDNPVSKRLKVEINICCFVQRPFFSLLMSCYSDLLINLALCFPGDWPIVSETGEASQSEHFKWQKANILSKVTQIHCQISKKYIQFCFYILYLNND